MVRRIMKIHDIEDAMLQQGAKESAQKPALEKLEQQFNSLNFIFYNM